MQDLKTTIAYLLNTFAYRAVDLDRALPEVIPTPGGDFEAMIDGNTLAIIPASVEDNQSGLALAIASAGIHLERQRREIEALKAELASLKAPEPPAPGGFGDHGQY